MKFLISLTLLSCMALMSEAGVSAYRPPQRPTNLECPRSQTFFPTERVEPECTSTDQCAPFELCCNWFGKKHCLEGIDTTPKDGDCPVGTVNPFEPCRQDFVGCSADSLCPGNKKCCKNVNCLYNECKAPAEPRACTRIGCRDTAGPDCKNVKLIQPNGPECNPICRVCADDEEPMTPRTTERPTEPATPPAAPTPNPRENLACPTSPFFFPVTDTDSATCTTDADCQSGELCCFFGTDERCKTGIDTTPKPGSCPANRILMPGCIADFSGCQFDSECTGTKKCCENSRCGYGECVATEPEPKPCTEIGCGPPPRPGCKNIERVRPNGEGCEPVCEVCRDPPTTPASTKPRAPRCRWVDRTVCNRRNSKRCRTFKSYVCGSSLVPPLIPRLY